MDEEIFTCYQVPDPGSMLLGNFLSGSDEIELLSSSATLPA
jgi:hypothetical protein